MKVEYKHTTTAARVEIYNASRDIFMGLLKEVRGLSRKKPEATLSSSKVKIVNLVLGDLLVLLKDEPEGKYLTLLDDDALPQVSDAVLIMVQFETVLDKFAKRYFAYVREYDRRLWITAELVTELKQLPDEEEDEESDHEGAR